MSTHDAPAAISLALAAPDLHFRRLAGDVLVLSSAQRLQPFSRCVGDWLEHWATVTPERVFLGERDPDGAWRTLTYGEALRRVRSVGQALLARGLGPERPVAALSPNSIAMAVVMLAAMHVGVPFAPVSQAYALLSTDYQKLKHTFALLTPGLVFLSDLATFGPALRKAGLDGFDVLVADGPTDGWQALSLAALYATTPGAEAERAFRALHPDTVGKILFTSGSTGMPKGVVNTHRMMCSNQEALAQLLPFLEEKPPVMVDWLPWNHTAGCNGSFNMLLRHGGSLYIDDGKPVAGVAFERTLRNLADIPSTLHNNVPRGYEMLVAELARNPAFQAHFFATLDYMCFAGAAMPRHHHEQLARMAREHRGDRIIFSAGYGATETGPAVTTVHFPNSEPANIGLPLPGTQVKLVPCEGKLEIRVRGPNVTPGYWRQPELSAGAFDDDGYYRIGDAARFLDAARPEAGLLFDGRVAEDFKLSSATWVNVAAVRAKALAAGAPIVQDVVVTGHDRDEIGLLVILNEPLARSHLDITSAPGLAELAGHEQVRGFIAAALARLGREATGSSNRPARALVLTSPPTLDTGELTDKGAVSQRMVLSCRAADVQRLYAEPADAAVIVAG